ncbi:MAG: hypothetical protein JWR83_2734, partial [Aeromicrobium sp.]|nr:hypothetical protein [Aeromicrobium sp.]
MTTVLTDRSRLEAMLRATASLHGNDVFDDPQRLRTLLSAESANMDAAGLASVERLLGSLSSGVRDLVTMTEPAEVPAERLRARCDLPYGDGVWLVKVVRSIVSPLTAGSSGEPPPSSDAELEMLPPPPTRSDKPTGSTRSRPLVIVLAAALVIVIGVGIAMVVSVRSSKLKAENELADARSGLTALQDQLNETSAALADVSTQSPTASTTASAVTAETDPVDSSTTDVSAIVGAIQAKIDEANLKLTDAQANLDAANATVSSLTTQLADRTAARDQLAAPFDVLMSAIRPTSEFFTATGNVGACTGWDGPCDATDTLYGHLTSTDAGLQFEWPGYVIIPLTFDGAAYRGKAPVA